MSVHPKNKLNLFEDFDLFQLPITALGHKCIVSIINNNPFAMKIFHFSLFYWITKFNYCMFHILPEWIFKFDTKPRAKGVCTKYSIHWRLGACLLLVLLSQKRIYSFGFASDSCQFINLIPEDWTLNTISGIQRTIMMLKMFHVNGVWIQLKVFFFWL